jgi:hypothetical protein
MRFASLYDAGDKAVHEDIITFAATKLAKNFVRIKD